MQIVAGVDEAGRGALAGPVVAGAVVLPDGFDLPGLGDSKKLTDVMRRDLFEKIKSKCDWGVGEASAMEIDTMGIKRATNLAMQRAVEKLRTIPDRLLVDGCDHFRFEIPAEEYVRGDERIPSISAASIIAKVTRDDRMIELSVQYPEWGFENHFGYGSESHRDLLEREVFCSEHRKSYNPLRTVLTQGKLF